MEFLRWCDKNRVHVSVVGTKIDKIGGGAPELIRLTNSLAKSLLELNLSYLNPTLHLVSGRTGEGIDELRRGTNTFDG